MTSWCLYKDWLQKEARMSESSVILTDKSSWFWRAIAAILAFLQIMTRRRFLEDFATTLGPIQSYPEGWPLEVVQTLIAHETQHTRQCRYFGLGISPWLGLPFMAIAYLLLPLPIGLAWVRYRLELNADQYRWRWMFDHGYPEEAVYYRAEAFAETVSSSAYGWAVPRAWALWGFRRALKREWLAYCKRVGKLI